MNSVTLDTLSTLDLTDSAKRFDLETHAVHRVDLHNELLRLALDSNDGTDPITFRLSSKVTDGSATEGWIEVNGQDRYYADLIVGADGIHSTLRPLVSGSKDPIIAPTMFSAFRFLIPSQVFQEHKDLAQLLMWRGSGAATLANPKDEIPERHMMWYGCRGYVVSQNYGC